MLVATTQLIRMRTQLMGGMTANEVLTSGENNTTYDAGYYIPASIGNYTWIDSNANGL